MRIAAVQMDVTFADVDANLARMIERLRETRSAKAALAVFPECAVSGYCFDSLDEALPYAESIPGPATDRISAACAELGGFAVFGMLEADGEQLYNAAVLAGPEGVIGWYRKIHLPFLGIDRFTTFGKQPFAVHDVNGVRVGLNICYDGSFPESARVMALQGADLIVLPTNWPPGSECIAAHGVNMRALENAVYYMSVNRVGIERGFRFIGRSRICGPTGNTLAESTDEQPAILYADIDPAKARNKRVVHVPDKHEVDRLADRRPEMYSALVVPHRLTRRGRE